MDYLLQWLSLFSMHFGIWVSFMITASIMRNGIPEPKELVPLFKSVIVLSLILSLVSSHSHFDYLKQFLKP